VAMCPKRGYGERTRADEEGDAPDIQFQRLALLIRHRSSGGGSPWTTRSGSHGNSNGGLGMLRPC
jgi:hypothetical protein